MTDPTLDGMIWESASSLADYMLHWFTLLHGRFSMIQCFESTLRRSNVAIEHRHWVWWFCERNLRIDLGDFLAAFDYQRVYVSLSNHILGTVTSISLGPVQWEYLLVIYRYVKRSLLWTWDVVHRMLQLWQPQGNCVFKPGLRKPWLSNLATTRIPDFQWVEYSKDDLANHDLVYSKNDL